MLLGKYIHVQQSVIEFILWHVFNKILLLWS